MILKSLKDRPVFFLLHLVEQSFAWRYSRCASVFPQRAPWRDPQWAPSGPWSGISWNGLSGSGGRDCRCGDCWLSQIATDGRMGRGDGLAAAVAAAGAFRRGVRGPHSRLWARRVWDPTGTTEERGLLKRCGAGTFWGEETAFCPEENGPVKGQQLGKDLSSSPDDSARRRGPGETSETCAGVGSPPVVPESKGTHG